MANEDPQDFQALVPPDMISPLPAPSPLPGPAPLPPPALHDPRAQLALIAALGAAIAGGRQSGLGGLVSGLQGGLHQIDQRNLQQYQFQEQNRLRNQQQLQQQQQQEQQRESQRQRLVESLVQGFSKQVPTFENVDQYEQQLGMTAAALRNLVGSRLNEQALRSNFPYVAPKTDKRAASALGQWMALPSNKKLLEQSPDDAAKAMVMFDVDGDTIPERIPLQRLAELAGTPFAQTQDGMVLSPKGSTKEDVANADAIYRDLHATALAQGKDDTPDLRNALRLKANRMHKESTQMPDEAVPPERVAAAADAILNHRMAPSQLTLAGSMGNQGAKFRQAVIGEVLRQNPQFNLQEAEANYQFGKNTGTQNTVRYLDQVRESMPLLLEQAQKLNNGKVRAINALINAGQNAVNNVDLKQFQTTRTLVADEVAKILQGGGTGSGTSDAKLRQAGNLLRTSDSPAAIAAALKDIDQLLTFRRQNITRGTFLDTPSTTGPSQPSPNRVYYDANGNPIKK